MPGFKWHILVSIEHVGAAGGGGGQVKHSARQLKIKNSTPTAEAIS